MKTKNTAPARVARVAREETEAAQLLRTVDQIVESANTGWQDVQFERADVDVRIVFSTDDAAARRRSRLPIPTIVYRASIGRLECEAPTAGEALEALVAAIKKSVARTSGAR
jgi:hypothetical protein